MLSTNPTRICPMRTIFHRLALGLALRLALGRDGLRWVSKGIWITTCWNWQRKVLALGVLTNAMPQLEIIKHYKHILK